MADTPPTEGPGLGARELTHKEFLLPGLDRNEPRFVAAEIADAMLAAIEGRIDPKSAAGVRRVPISRQLGSILDEHEAYIESRLGRSLHEDERYFPGDPIGEKFCPNALVERADKCWAEADLEPVRLHDARHTFASYLIAAGVNAKAIQTYMGHPSIQVTYDIYGHLFPGNEAEAAALLDDYLTGGSPNRSPSRARAT